MNETFSTYKTLNFVPSLEDEKGQIYEYVFVTNKLEGNKLTLAQTVSLLDKGSVTGENISLHDILEQKGMFKAVTRMFNAVKGKEPLSVGLMKELNWLVLGALWKDDSVYLSAKEAGQGVNEFKQAANLIRVTTPDGKTINIEPLSSPENVEQNMKNLVDSVNTSDKDSITKAAFLAQELWLHQPFVDGNKRTGRLLVNFLTLKEGYPFFVFDDRAANYNSLLVGQYIEEKPGLVDDYIRARLDEEMKRRIDQVQSAKQNRGKGYRFML